jgi:hypothetical protein
MSLVMHGPAERHYHGISVLPNGLRFMPEVQTMETLYREALRAVDWYFEFITARRSPLSDWLLETLLEQPENQGFYRVLLQQCRPLFRSWKLQNSDSLKPEFASALQFLRRKHIAIHKHHHLPAALPTRSRTASVIRGARLRAGYTTTCL